MKSLYTVLFLSLCSVPFLTAQLTVDTGMAPTQMVQNLVGPGVQIFNVQVTAAANSYGYYTATNTELGTSEGLLLTTGRAVNAIGPNNSSGLPQIGPGGVCLNCSLFDNNFPGSALLTQAQGRPTYDATMFEFDIIPQGDSLSFSYSFASEEYNEWVGSPFNDVFGFYISGPNVGTDVNLALVPNTSQAVAINNVNNLSNSQYYYNNQNPFGQLIQYDGFTVNLVAAVGDLIPCQTYHLKLVIADGSDRLYDSGVFVNKIESNPLVVLTATAGGLDYMIEGCNDGVLSFCRTFSTPTPQDVVFWLGGTAAEGVDYTQLGSGIPLDPITVTIPGDALCVDVPLSAFEDGIDEDDEYLTIYLGNPLCNNEEVADSVNFYIKDKLTVAVSADPTLICVGQCTTLQGTALTDGSAFFTWSPTTNMDNPASLTPEVCPTEETTYTLTSQVASCFGQASVTIGVSSIQVTFDTTDDNCAGANTGAIDLSVIDALPPYDISWTGPDGFTSTDEDLTGIGPGQYCADVTDDAGCVVSGCATIVQNNELAITSAGFSDYLCFPISCNGASDGSIDIEVSGGVPGYGYSWTGPNNFTSGSQDLNGIPAGTYVVTITDQAGCILIDSYTLTEPDPVTISVVGEVDLLCTGFETGSAEVSAAGGCSPYFYSWSHDPNLEAPLALNLGSGTYTVSVQDVNGCSSQGSVLIEINDPIDPITLTVDVVSLYPGGFGVSCPDASDGFVNTTIAGGSLPYVIEWTGPDGYTASAEDISGLTCGSYNLTVTDDNGCAVSGSANLSCVPQIQITSLATPNPCADPNAGLGSIEILTTSGGNGGAYSYDWTDGGGFTSTDEDIFNLNAAAYTVTVTDAFGCTNEFTINVGTNDSFDASANISNVSCSGDCNGSINVTVSPPGVYNYTWTGPGGALPSTQDQFNLCAGTYELQIESAGCVGFFTYTLNDPPAIEIDVASSVAPVCFGQNSGSIDVDVTGGLGILSFEWAPVPGSFFPGSSNEDISGLFDGCYTLTVTDQTGCTNSETVCLTAPQVMQISVEVTEFFGGFNISCAGAQDGQISVTVSGGTPDCVGFAPYCYSYDWSGCSDVAPNDPNSNLLTSLSGGVYCVDVFDANGCLATTTITLTEPDPIQDAAVVTNITCFGDNDGTITPNLSGGSGNYVSYNWTQGNIGNNNPAASTLVNLGPGCYTLQVTDNNQCTQDFTWCITEPEELVLTLDLTLPDCLNPDIASANLSASGGTPDYSFVTTGPGGPYNGQTLSNLGPGNYNVTVTDEAGCSVSDSFTVQSFNAFDVQIEAFVLQEGDIYTLQCFGDSNAELTAVVTGGEPDYAYIWTDGDGNLIGSGTQLTGLAAGNYCVEVVDSNGCSTTDCFEVTQPDSPLAFSWDALEYIGGYNVSCFGVCDGAIDLTVSGGVAPYVYLWEVGDGELSTDEDQVALCAGAPEVLVTDDNGCSQLVQMTLSSPLPIVIQPTKSVFDGGANVSCLDACDGTIDLNLLGGDPGYTTEWTNPVLPDGTSQENLCAGAYVVLVTDSRGCTRTQTISLTEPELLVATFQSAFNCSTGELTICAVAGGGSGIYGFSWGELGAESCISVTESGEYCVDVTDSNGCFFSLCETFVVPEVLTATLTGTSTTCGQDNGTLDVTVNSGTEPYDFTWTGTGVTQGQSSQTDIGTGDYTVTVVDDNNCSLTLSITIVEENDIVVDVSATDVLCYGNDDGTISVDITGAASPITYSWTSGGNPVPGNDVLSDLTPGVYLLNWTDDDGCSGSESIAIAEPDSLSINATISLYSLGYNLSGFESDDGIIDTDVQGGVEPYTYDWSVDGLDGEPDLTGLPAGTYELLVTDENGCRIDTIIVLTQPYDLTLPTGLSPNGDGDNDTYVILGIEAFPNNEFRVFNRWGNLVYEKNDYQNEWGGQNKNGDTLPDSTYFVVFVAGGREFNTYVDLRR